MNICVLCSAAELDDKYQAPARRLAKLIAEHGHDLIWGGSDTGLMNIVASGVQAGGGKIVGISIEPYKQAVRKDVDEMIIAKSLGERKAIMLERSDAIISLVGGVGTLDEITDFAELKKHGAHIKPIVVLDTDNFYEGLRIQFQRIMADGFLRKSLSIDDLILFAHTPEEVINFVENAPQP